MVKINSFKQELICLALSVLFLNFYLIFEEPRESLCLILSFYFMFKVFNTEKQTQKSVNKSKKRLLQFCSILLTYVIVQVFLYLNTPNPHLNIEKSYTKQDKKAILLVYEGEASNYNLKNQIRNLKTNGTILEKMNLTIMLNKSKRNYYKIGKSDYRKKAVIIKERLQRTMGKDEYEVHLSFFKDRNYVEDSIIGIVNNGFSEVIVIPMFIESDKSYERIDEIIKKTKLFNEEINIRYTEVFSSSEKLINSYMKKIDNQINEEKISSTGIILIGKGLDPSKEEVLFRSKIKDYLNKFSNVEEKKIKKAWLSNSSPNYVSKIKDILELGISDLIVVYTEPGVTNIENKEIYENIIKKVRFPEGVKIKLIDGFLTQDDLIEEIKNRIEMLELM